MAKTKKITKASKPKKAQEKSSFQKLFEKKPHIEFFVALLSIPFFLSVILINFNTLKGLNNAKLTPTPAVQKDGNSSNGSDTSFYAQPIGDKTPSANTTTQPCKKALGPVSITSPEENENVNDNPATLSISYDDETYCGAAWSYRINGGNWSGYDDRSVALYNLPKGDIKIDLRVRSIASNDERTITRNFTYTGDNSNTNQPNASGSGQ